ncbi:multidrug efflux SMR transporter [Dysgonomonas sp. 25]|uniref:DMT family transporter n=1 Tax=Dysgonomonas sp. 25 TaxID=2302933 RepID=UPI0013D3B12A|nr:multidrug efflux SMR transporter [Dysgonomonas sp. 25]NDV68494.1 QacE family quaternary ammonium compound efflux SMR transporter [Dysgonomonas sp. 25]
MNWFFLILAGLSEIVWAYGLKMTHGFTDIKWSIITICFMFVSFLLFAKSMRTIPIGTAYAVFTGIGAAGTAIVGIVGLGEELGVMKVISLSILIGGIIGLKMIDKKTAKTEDAAK